MADETYELVIRISPEGAEETQDALEGVNEEFEDAADGAEESSGRLSKFASKWKGAMQVVVAGLAVAATGLLTQVPVIQDLMDGLGAIVESVALKLDEELRPVFEPLVEELFNFAEQVDESDASLLGFLETLDEADGVDDPAFTQAFERLPGIVDRATAAVDNLLRVAERLGLDDAFRAEFAAINEFADFSMDVLLSIVEFGLDVLAGDWSGAWNSILGFTERTLNRLVNLATFLALKTESIFGDWIQRQVLGFRDFWATTENTFKKGANRVLDTVESMVNRAIRALNKLPGFNIGRVNLGRFDVKSEAQLARESEARRRQAEENRQTFRNSLADRQEIVLRFDPPELGRIFGEIQGQGVDVLGRGTGR